MRYRYPTMLGLAIASSAAIAQVPTLPAAPAPNLMPPALPAAPALPPLAAPDASAVTGPLESGQAMFVEALPSGGGAPALPGLPAAPSADDAEAAMAMIAEGEAALMDLLPAGGNTPAPDASAVTDAIAEGEAMLMDGLPETGTLDVDSSIGIDTEAGGFSNSYSAQFPEQGGGVVEGNLMDESFTFAYGGTLEELGFSYSVAGEEAAGSINLAEPQENELPAVPELPMP